MGNERIESALKEALAACRHASDVRGYHARRTSRGTKQREDDLTQARERVRLAMAPLRSYLGRAQYDTQSQANIDLQERVRTASKELQSERRKLWKMQTPESRAKCRTREPTNRASA